MRRLVLLMLLAASCRKHESGFTLHGPVPAFSAALEQTTGVALQPGHRLQLLDNGAVFDALAADVGKAQRSINAETFIWTNGTASDRVLDAIKQRTEKGVICRVLLDAVGSAPLRDELIGKFAAARCQVRVFRPIPGPDNAARNHRKVFVIDGRVGFTGGFGVDDKWLGDGLSKKNWRDTNVRVEGPAVAQMQQSFAENWQEPAGDFLPASDFPRLEEVGPAKAAFVRSDAAPVVTRAERLTQLAIAAARKRLWIENAYFAPSHAILDLLGRQAAAGVDVRMVVAGRKSDSKLEFLWAQTDYGELQKRGVRIWEYQASMIHSKTMLIDDSLLVIGSVNLEPFSLNKLEEGAIVAEDEGAARKLATDFEEDCARSKEQK
ncbi:MAG: phosphatidylserine/phosphatidylglycerophosphate/cardiolipin synthase family protein [Myxococcales bacterium]|nr:phospholipase D-like domain-containing protein [Myxococcales bacterium]